MIGENRLSFRNYWLKFKFAGKVPIILEESMEYISQSNKGKPKDVNMYPVWLGKTRISTGPMIEENRS